MKLDSLWLATALLAVTAFGAPAQENDEDVRRHGIFIDSLDVSLINLEVYVSRDGEPVTDLSAEEFEVLDDGEPVEITNFYRVEAGRRVAQEQEESDLSDPSDTLHGAMAPSTVVVLVDHRFISPLSRKFVFDQLAERLDQLIRDGTQVMVASKEQDVEIVQPPTVNQGEVEATLGRLAELVTPNYRSEVLQAIREIDQGSNATASRQSGPGGSRSQTESSELDARSAFQEATAHSQQMYTEARRSFAVLRDFVGALAGLPGRKAVLYVADRVPVRAGELVWRVWFEKYGFDWGSRFGATSAEAATREYDSSDALRDLIADANANRVGFYPIGAGADAGPNLLGVESEGLRSPSRFSSQTAESDEGLEWLAKATGGRAAIGRGDSVTFFDDLQEDLTHYYSLAYASPHRGDGEAHKVEVRLRSAEHEDLEVRYLSEYRDKSADQQMQERTLSALMLGTAENPLEVRIEIGDGKKQKGGYYVVPLEVRVPVGNLVLVPDKKSHFAKVSIQLISRDDRGRLSDPAMIRLPIEIPNPGLLEALLESAVYRTELTMARGSQTVAVAVRDDLGSTSSTVQVHVEVGGRG